MSSLTLFSPNVQIAVVDHSHSKVVCCCHNVDAMREGALMKKSIEYFHLRMDCFATQTSYI